MQSQSQADNFGITLVGLPTTQKSLKNAGSRKVSPPRNQAKLLYSM